MSSPKEFLEGFNDEIIITTEQWNAIIDNDESYNNQFFYAVKTTGIFCKPSCNSRAPKKDNVRIFQTAAEALSAHFRPCKRCKPTNERLPNHEWVALITRYIERNYHAKLTLENLAEVGHGSPYHLHRTFKKIIGITPVQYIQQVRINQAKHLLIHSDQAVTDIAKVVGIANTSYFITLFKKMTGDTPVQYRQLRGENFKLEG